jgi:hypothetical protein
LNHDPNAAWGPEMRRAGIENAALYLVRPDGYVALADREANPERLRHYFGERMFRQQSGEGRHDG